MSLLISLIILLGLLGLLHKGVSLIIFASACVVSFILSIIFSLNGLLMTILGIAALICFAFSAIPLRQKYISTPFFSMFKKMLPALSETEKEAIDAGTVWWDGQLFSGNPDWKSLTKIEMPKLSIEEQAFLDGPVNELCRMSDAWKINHDWNMIPDHIIDFILKNGFLAMIIPKEYGGLGLSGVAQSQVLIKISNTGAAITYAVAVPNSLGPGELLMKYGTEEQKNYYLPRLSEGKEIPCFALTGPTAGSDATSIPDTGIVCKGQWEGKEVIGMRLNFSKRYITLAPIATLVGLAFRLKDPEHLIGEVDDYGITCALLPRETEGLIIGRRHLPIGDAFLNGPLAGENIFVPLDYIIGGQEMAGKGWRMLVNCLSVGRCITLPTGGVAYSKRAIMGTTAYASLRRQFGVQIKQFEGVQKPLARMAGLAYIINAARLHTIQAVDAGEKPAVPSAILKYHCTEMARQCLLDAMDIHGGKAVMKGPKNYIASGYESIPVSITVEGANILTRNLMIFGQGATRSHPYVLEEMQLAEKDADDEVINDFDSVLFKHIGFTISNGARAFLSALTSSRIFPNPGHATLGRYYSHLTRLSAAFALIADVSMLSLQSKLKLMEMLSARLGDLLSDLYLASMVLKHYENDGCPSEDLPLVQWSLDYLIHHYQEAFKEIIDNYPNRPLAYLLRATVFPLGMHFKAPSDKLEKSLAQSVTENNSTRDRLVSGLYVEQGDNNPLGHVNEVFIESLGLEPLNKKIRQAIKDKKLPKMQGIELIEKARDEKIISKEEADQLVAFNDQLMSVIHVDDFDQEELIRTPCS
ncbi:MAG: acyl-CoA dehydrogenase [Gammaproteobacteria bacterium]|jgi:acyl-CoA dehydrogenase